MRLSGDGESFLKLGASEQIVRLSAVVILIVVDILFSAVRFFADVHSPVWRWHEASFSVLCVISATHPGQDDWLCGCSVLLAGAEIRTGPPARHEDSR